MTDALKRKSGRHGGHGAAGIEGRAERGRDKAESWGEKSREREDAKKGKFGGQGERDETETAFEETKGGPCAGNCHLGSSRDQLVTNLNPIRLICASPTGSPISRPPSKGGWPRSPNSLRRINESGKPQLGPPLNDYFKEDWKGRGYETGASVARSRVFVITGLCSCPVPPDIVSSENSRL